MSVRDTTTYYRAACRRAGVPDLWVPDAASDMALALWLDGKADDVLAIRREAIDCARRYGPHTRYGGVRPVTASLEDVAGTTGLDSRDRLILMPKELQTHDEYLGLVLLDIRRAAKNLTTKQRQALSRRLRGLPMSNVDSTHASAARRALRKALAA